MITSIIYAAGAGGIPDTSRLLAPPPLESYQHSITATSGFESCELTAHVTPDVALYWLQNGLMASAIMSGPEIERVWEGALVQVQATFGQEQRSVSLDAMANRVRCRYTTVLGTPGTTTFASNATSNTRYGTKDSVLGIGNSSATPAAALRDAELARRAFPVAVPTSTIATGDLGDVSLTLNFAGWYALLDWLLTANSATSSAVTTTIVQNLLTTYAAVNPFLSTDYSQIVASGLNESQYIAPDTTVRAAIETVLGLGNSAGQRLAWGVYENRRFQVAPWAGATPTATTYRRTLDSPLISDVNGLTIQPWNVRPNAMVEVVDLLDIGAPATAVDTGAQYFVERVTCTINGGTIGVTLEPAAGDSLDARLSRIK